MSEAREGEMYLVDYYALLGVERNAEGEAMKKAYWKKQQQYHPDRYQGLAPELQAVAAKTSEILGRAYAVLSDPEKKHVYDKKLRDWKGPVSKDGRAIVDLTREYFNAAALLEATPPDKVMAYVIDAVSGFDVSTFRLVEQEYRRKKRPRPALKAAYREQLQRKDAYSELQESLEFKVVGLENREFRAASFDHKESVKAEVAFLERKAEEALDQTILLIKNGEQKLLGHGAEDVVLKIQEANGSLLAEYRAAALERFKQAASRITAFAAKREKIVRKRYAMIEAEYRPAQKLLYPRLIVAMDFQAMQQAILFTLEGENQIVPHMENGTFRGIEKPSVAKRWITRGHNVLIMKPVQGLDLKDQLREVTGRHFGAWKKQSKSKR